MSNSIYFLLVISNIQSPIYRHSPKVPKNPKILGSRAKTHAGGCCVGGLKGLEDDAKFEACVVRLP